MSDEKYGGDIHAWIEPEIEARLVAMILGEASEFESEELERLMEEQAGDGGFAELSLGGPETRTSQTVDAMIAIVRLCAVLDVQPD